MIGAILGILLKLSATNRPQVLKSDQLVTYPIHGSTAPQLRQQMALLGSPDRPPGKRFGGWTHWHVDWHFWYRTDANGCHVDRSIVLLVSTVNVPEWMDEAKGPMPLQREWNRFITGLKLHESGHRDNGVRAAEAIRGFIDKVGSSASCYDLGRHINAYAHVQTAEATLADVNYDAATVHGRTQGAALH